jgi:HSP20 family protein
MELKVWTPLLDLEKDMRTFLDRFWPGEVGEPMAIRLVTDMRRENGGLVVTVEMPGIDPEKDVDISVDGDMLTIKGEKTEEKETKAEDRYLRERKYGRFERRIALPDGVDSDAIKASYDKGILTVRVPLPVEAAPEAHKIPVTTGS